MTKLWLLRGQSSDPAAAIWAIVLMLALVVVLAGCSNPIDRSADPGKDDGSPAAEQTTTAVPMMDIVTPTPGSGEPAPPESSEPTGPVEAPDIYVVQDGDTLYAISSRFGLELSAVVEANNLSDPNDIFVGQELVLPKP